VTYRDDHDAAIARAGALADALKRTEAERDRLREQVAKQAEVTAPPTNPVALAPPQPEAMTAHEVDALVDALAAGAKQIRISKTARIAGAGSLIVVAFAMCFTAAVLPALLILALGTVALVASALVDHGDHAPIIEAVRDHPEEVVEIRERVTTKGNRWLTITARNGTWARFRSFGTTALVVTLARRCKGATVS
jgi:hypothetical protein